MERFARQSNVPAAVFSFSLVRTDGGRPAVSSALRLAFGAHKPSDPKVQIIRWLKSLSSPALPF